MRFLPAVPFLLALAACGGKSFIEGQAPTVPLGGFGQVTVELFTIDGLEGLPEDKKGKAMGVAAEITESVRERLADRKLFASGGKVLTIKGRITGFNEGSKALRYFVGFGAGKGEIIVETTFADEAGAKVAAGSARGTVSGGWFGGSTRDASRRVARAIVDYLESRMK
jgi:hypothetical protein